LCVKRNTAEKGKTQIRKVRQVALPGKAIKKAIGKRLPETKNGARRKTRKNSIFDPVNKSKKKNYYGGEKASETFDQKRGQKRRDLHICDKARTSKAKKKDCKKNR